MFRLDARPTLLLITNLSSFGRTHWSGWDWDGLLKFIDFLLQLLQNRPVASWFKASTGTARVPRKRLLLPATLWSSGPPLPKHRPLLNIHLIIKLLSHRFASNPVPEVVSTSLHRWIFSKPANHRVDLSPIGPLVEACPLTTSWIEADLSPSQLVRGQLPKRPGFWGQVSWVQVTGVRKMQLLWLGRLVILNKILWKYKHSPNRVAWRYQIGNLEAWCEELSFHACSSQPCFCRMNCEQHKFKDQSSSSSRTSLEKKHSKKFTPFRWLLTPFRWLFTPFQFSCFLQKLIKNCQVGIDRSPSWQTYEERVTGWN